jgi:hypothetical protein
VDFDLAANLLTVDAAITRDAEAAAAYEPLGVAFSDLSGAATDGQVPNTITIDLAAVATTANAVGTDAVAQIADIAAAIKQGTGTLLQTVTTGTDTVTMQTQSSANTVVVTVTNPGAGGVSLEGEAHPTEGGTFGAREGADDGTNTARFKLPNAGLTADRECVVTDAADFIPNACVSDTLTVSSAGSVDGAALTTLTVGDTALAAAAVDGGAAGEIADNTVTFDDLAANSVGSSEIGLVDQRVSLIQGPLGYTAVGVWQEPAVISIAPTNWGGVMVQTFDNTATRDCIYGQATVPSDYAANSSVVVNWTSTVTTNAVDWELDYKYVAAGETLDAATETALDPTDATAPATTKFLVTSDLGAPATGVGANKTLLWALCRNGAGTDNLAGKVYVYDVLFEYDN